jgi:hypothetical protein
MIGGNIALYHESMKGSSPVAAREIVLWHTK